jgi:hypothetical protein
MKLVDLEGSICTVVHLNSEPIVLYPCCSGLYFIWELGIYRGFSFFFPLNKVPSEGGQAHFVLVFQGDESSSRVWLFFCLP